MKQFDVFRVALLVICLCCPANSMAETGLSIEFPPVGSFVENELLNVVLDVNKLHIDTVRIISKKNDPTEVDVQHNSSTVCLGITLEMGMNTIQFVGIKQGKAVAQKEMKIFFRSDLFPQFRIPPAGFKRYYFHITENEKSCIGCHNMEPTLSSLRPVKPEESPCYTCHVRKSNNAFTHNPAAQWTCLACHEVLQGKRKYTTPKPDQKVCYPCHNRDLKDWKEKKFMHGPTAVGNCTLCHNPHGSGWPSLLRMQTTDLCVNCHEDKATGTHVIAGFYGKGHPVRGVKNPFNPDLEFTCSGCHNPHAGDSQNLLRQDNSNLTVYCSFCHKM